MQFGQKILPPDFSKNKATFPNGDASPGKFPLKQSHARETRRENRSKEGHSSREEELVWAHTSK